MKKTSKLILFILALCVAVLSTGVIAFADGELAEETVKYNNLTALDSVRTEVKKAENISGSTFKFDNLKDDMKKLVQVKKTDGTFISYDTAENADNTEYDGLFEKLQVILYVLKPNSSLPTSATSTKADGTFPTISLSSSGTYSFWVLYGDKEYEPEYRYTMTTEDLKFKADGWYEVDNTTDPATETLKVPVFSFNYASSEGLSITASGGGEDGIVNHAYSDITFNITNGNLSTLTLEYSADSTDGTDGTWAKATDKDAEYDETAFTESSISFVPLKTGYFRVVCVAQANGSDEYGYKTATVKVSKEYTEVKLVDMRFRDFIKNNWKSLIFLGLAVLSLIGIVVIALYKPKDASKVKVEVKEDAGKEEVKVAEAIEAEDEENAEEVTEAEENEEIGETETAENTETEVTEAQAEDNAEKAETEE